LIAKRLTVNNFRNLKNASVALSEGVNVFLGGNGMGKTNLLEAQWLFTAQKSFRPAKDSDIIKIGEENAEIELEFFAESRMQNAEIALSRIARRKVFLNEIEQKPASSFFGKINAIIFSPEHLQLVKEGPFLRRRFLDTAISQISPKYYAALALYKKTLDQRNAILRDVKKNHAFYDTLPIWNERLASAGAVLIYLRKGYTALLSKHACKIYDEISSQSEKLSMEYVCSVDDGGTYEDIKERFLDKLSEDKTVELTLRTTLHGPHRDDLRLMKNDLEAKSYASQGQQRSIVLALKLAEAEILSCEGKSPIILLDDVMSELDAKRREFVLCKTGGKQVIITACDEKSINTGKNAAVFHIKDGVVL